MEDDFGIHRRLEDRTIAHQLVTQFAGICQVAIMGHGKAAKGQVGKDWLDVAQHRPALGRIAVVADGSIAGQTGAQVAAEMVADKAHVTL